MPKKGVKNSGDVRKELFHLTNFIPEPKIILLSDKLIPIATIKQAPQNPTWGVRSGVSPLNLMIFGKYIYLKWVAPRGSGVSAPDVFFQ